MFKKIIAVMAITIILVITGMPGIAEGFTLPEAPSAPSVPSAPSSPEPPAPPTIPSAPIAPTLQEILESEQSATSENSTIQEATNTSLPESSSPQTQTSDQSINLTGQISNGNVGDTTIRTGNATNTAETTTVTNNNIAPYLQGSGTDQVINSGGGADSLNYATVTGSTNNETSQDNIADVSNSFEQTILTGQNSASQNVGESYIVTGDANTTGTTITSVNTNANALSVAEFNIADTHRGDLILDFSQNCISGCQPAGSTLATNTQNGANSQNTINASNSSTNETLQNNDATLGNNLTLSADSGSNLASQNTGGDSSINTGNANVSGNSITMANNNVSGNILYSVVNIFGQLIGNIILPEALANSTEETNNSQKTSNSGNGTNSQNTINLTQANGDVTNQVNDALINNNLNLAATTGDNQTSRNTDGNSSIRTGQAEIESQTINVANSNVEGGNMWLVIVNRMGEWVGQILGTPTGSTLAGSSGTTITVGPYGEITASNSNNGAGSENTANISETSSGITSQENSAQISNNLNLSANTGKNQATDNTGGTSYIQTGDAQIIANIVNFVNNNISSRSRLIVTVVNVFGSWIGDFVTPGSREEPEPPTQESNPTGGEQPTENGSGGDNNIQSPEGNQGAGTDSSANTQSDLSEIDSLPQAVEGLVSNGVRVAGIRIEIEPENFTDFPVTGLSQSDTPKEVTINLAWLLLLLPLAALAAGIKKLLNKAGSI